jgi:hypothetical protein
MTRSEDPSAGRGPEGRETEADVLRRLEERLDRAAQAAERLLGDAAVAAAGPGLAGGDADSGAGPGGSGPGGSPRIPPAGWQRPADGDPVRRTGEETELLLGILGALRDRIPPELQRRLTEAVREVLMAVRALIDWYLERTERQRAEPVRVQDIPIL